MEFFHSDEEHSNPEVLISAACPVTAYQHLGFIGMWMAVRTKRLLLYCRGTSSMNSAVILFSHLCLQQLNRAADSEKPPKMSHFTRSRLPHWDGNGFKVRQ